MSVRVYNQEVFESLQRSTIKDAEEDNSKKKKTKSTKLNNSNSGALRLKSKHEKFVAEQRAREEKVQKTTRDNIRKSNARKDAYYNYLCREIDAATSLGDELQSKIDLSDATAYRRQRKLHDDWTTDVYDKIHAPIRAAIDAIGPETLNARRRGAYQNFLNQTNTKGALFRDIINTEDYDPFNDNPSIKASVSGVVANPCRRVLQKKEEEDAIAGKKLSATAATGRQDNLEVRLWQAGVFESTPHGYFNKLTNTKSSTTKQRTGGVHMMSHYDVATGKEVVDKEIPKGKRTEFSFETPAAKTNVNLKF